MTLEHATPQAGSKKMFWAGWIISALPILLMTVAPIAGFFFLEQMSEKMSKYGYSRAAVIGITVTELCCAIIYAIPKTAVLGAILMTAYLGGATCHHVRAGEPFFTPPIVGVLVWLGLYLRDSRIRALLPFRQ